MKTLVMATIAAGLFALAGPAAGESRRVDLFNDRSQRRGHAIVDEKRDRVDFYDAKSRREGYGKIRGGRIDLFNRKHERKGFGMLPGERK